MIVRSEFRDLDTPTGPMRTHVYTPARPTGSQRFPGLLLYPEIYQQTGPIARLSAQFASHGYVVMAPEIYALDLRQRRSGRHPGPGGSSRLQRPGGHGRLLHRRPPCAPRSTAPQDPAAACFYATDLHTGTLGEGKNADSLARARDRR
jgi:carboxymethylenebutenolidase